MTRPWMIVTLALTGLAACKQGGQDPVLNGYWYAVEINGERTLGSRVQLDLEDVDPNLFEVSNYALAIDCDDTGRYDRKRGALVSDLRNPYETIPQAQCEARDAKRLDDLRLMTHEGVTIRFDPKTYAALLSTASGRTARFDYMDTTPVD